MLDIYDKIDKGTRFATANGDIFKCLFKDIGGFTEIELESGDLDHKVITTTNNLSKTLATLDISYVVDNNGVVFTYN